MQFFLGLPGFRSMELCHVGQSFNFHYNYVVSLTNNPKSALLNLHVTSSSVRCHCFDLALLQLREKQRKSATENNKKTIKQKYPISARDDKHNLVNVFTKFLQKSPDSS